MKLGHECLPCLLCQAENLCDQVHLSEKRRAEVLLKTSAYLSSHFSLDTVSTDLGTGLQRFVTAEVGVHDPYHRVKEESNAMARRIVERVGSLPFRKAIMASIAGNLIDYSLDEVSYDMEKDFGRILSEPLAIDHSQELKREIHDADRILFLADNCGEIILDTFLLEHLRGKSLLIAGKGAPYANDATASDLRRWGLGEYGPIVSTGSGYLGLKESPAEFLDLFGHSLVLAKGMGWYEYLSEGRHRNVFHLFRVKCARVAREVGVPKGSNVCMRNHR